MRPEKIAILDQVREEVKGSPFVILADFRGVTVAETETLRNQLAEANARYRVVKNSMLKIVADEMDASALARALVGQTAMVYGAGDMVEIAKTVREFVKKTGKLAVKSGMLEGRVVSAEDIQELADMPPREVMQGLLVSAIAAPMTSLMGVCKQKLSSIVYVLQAAHDKQSEP